MSRAANFDPSKYGVTMEQWCSMTRDQRQTLRRSRRGYFRERYWRDVEKTRENARKRYAKNPEIRREQQRQSYWKHHDRQLARFRARWAKIGSLNKVKSDPDKVYWLAVKAVPAALPRHVRDDVIGSILLSVMEGKTLVRDIAKSARQFVTAHNRDFDHFKTLSLDATMPGTDVTYVERLTIEDLP